MFASPPSWARPHLRHPRPFGATDVLADSFHGTAFWPTPHGVRWPEQGRSSAVTQHGSTKARLVLLGSGEHRGGMRRVDDAQHSTGQRHTIVSLRLASSRSLRSADSSSSELWCGSGHARVRREVIFYQRTWPGFARRQPRAQRRRYDSAWVDTRPAAQPQQQTTCKFTLIPSRRRPLLAAGSQVCVTVLVTKRLPNPFSKFLSERLFWKEPCVCVFFLFLSLQNFPVFPHVRRPQLGAWPVSARTCCCCGLAGAGCR